MGKRLRVGAIVLLLLLIVFAAGAGPFGDRGGPLSRHCQLQSRLANAEARIAALNLRLASIESNAVLELDDFVVVEKKNINRMNGPHIIFRGANVHIQNGSGITFEDNRRQRGVGNLVIGYNEDVVDEIPGDRKGWHNLIIGERHRYYGPAHDLASYGGMVVGSGNTIAAPHAVVCGGGANTASGRSSCVTGGSRNVASGDNSSISGGSRNKAQRGNASVSGGWRNDADGQYASVSGGYANRATGDLAASVSGGYDNNAGGDYSSVGGGYKNTAGGDYSSVSGGANRSVDEGTNWRAGGLFQPR